MGKYDFDRIIDRRGTDSVKHDLPVQKGMPAGTVRMFIADMDFEVPKEVSRAIARRAGHPIYGYSIMPAGYNEVFINWMSERHGWDVSPEWIIPMSGVVPGIRIASRAFAGPDEAILIQTPVYHLFRSSVEMNGRRIVESPLSLTDGKYTIDFDDFEKKIVDEKVKAFILCSPHNPLGRVWTMDELARMSEICAKYGVVILADEIHADFVFKGHRHIAFPLANKGAKWVVFTSPGKTFNLAGLKIGNVVIEDEELRGKFLEELSKSEMTGTNTFGAIALKAAYEFGADWVDELALYIEGNIDYMLAFLRENIPGITAQKPEGTYLMWLNCRGLGIPSDELAAFFAKAGVWITPGASVGFGGDCEGYVRMNIACPRLVLMEALGRIKAAADSLGK